LQGVVIGVGVNLNMDRKSLGTIDQPATSSKVDFHFMRSNPASKTLPSIPYSSSSADSPAATLSKSPDLPRHHSIQAPLSVVQRPACYGARLPRSFPAKIFHNPTEIPAVFNQIRPVFE
jgi:hypothetical protein